MLKNAYLLANIGADTAENEKDLPRIRKKFGNYPIHVWDVGGNSTLDEGRLSDALPDEFARKIRAVFLRAGAGVWYSPINRFCGAIVFVLLGM